MPLAAAVLFIGCARTFPREFVSLDATRVDRPVMLSRVDGGRCLRREAVESGIREIRLTYGNFVLVRYLPARKAAPTLAAGFQSNERWLQVDATTFHGVDRHGFGTRDEKRRSVVVEARFCE